MKKTFIQKMFSLRAGLTRVKKSRLNDHYNSSYFDINDTLAMLNPLLKKNKLLLKQPLKGNRIYTIVQDIEANDKGEYEFEESFLDLPPDLNPQKMGGAITFYRRYTLVALFGLEAEDDDGNLASGINKRSNPSAAQTTQPLVKPRTTPQNAPKQKPNIPTDKSAPVTGIPNDKKPWLNLWDPGKKMFTNHYIKMVDEKVNNGLSKARVLSMYKVNKRDREFLDKLFDK